MVSLRIPFGGRGIGDGKAGQGEQLSLDRPQAEALLGQHPGEGVEVGGEGADAIEDGGAGRHDGRLGAVLDIARMPARRVKGLWTSRGPVHDAPAAAAEPERPSKVVNRNPPGTIPYAMATAVAGLGQKVVSEVTGLSRSAVYAGANADDPRGFPSVTLEQGLILARMLAAKGRRAEVFALPFLRAAGVPDPDPHSPDLMHQAAHLGVLYGRTAEALCRLFDRAGGKRRPVPLDPRDREAAIAAIDAQIDGLRATRALLLTTTALQPLWAPPAPHTMEEESAC